MTRWLVLIVYVLIMLWLLSRIRKHQRLKDEAMDDHFKRLQQREKRDTTNDTH